MILQIPEGTEMVTEDLALQCVKEQIATRQKHDVTEVVIPEGVTTIHQNSFFQFDEVSAIHLPNSLTHIGKFAFSNCEALDNVLLPPAIAHIGGGAFSYCTNLHSVILPDKAIEIGYRAFACTALEKVGANWSKNVLYVDNHAIGAFTRKDGECVIRDSTISIANCAFADTRFTNIIIPDSVKHIGKSAFARCEKLEDLDIPNGVTTINHCTFIDCSCLSSVTIPDSVTSIQEFAFTRCFNFKYIALSDNISYIHDFAFSGVSPEFTIACNPMGYAEDYALDKGILYDYIEKEPVYADWDR